MVGRFAGKGVLFERRPEEKHRINSLKATCRRSWMKLASGSESVSLTSSLIPLPLSLSLSHGYKDFGQVSDAICFDGELILISPSNPSLSLRFAQNY